MSSAEIGQCERRNHDNQVLLGTNTPTYHFLLGIVCLLVALCWTCTPTCQRAEEYPSVLYALQNSNISQVVTYMYVIR